MSATLADDNQDFFDLDVLQSSGSASACRHDGDRWTLADSPTLDWHFVWRSYPPAALCRARMVIEVEPTAGCTTKLAINLIGVDDVAIISPEGEVERTSLCEACTVTRLDGQVLRIEAEFAFFGQQLALGCSLGLERSHYHGRGQEQFIVHRCTVAMLALPPIEYEDKIRLIDVGAADGVQVVWHRFAEQIEPVLFEPNPAEAAKLRGLLGKFPGIKIVEHGLSYAKGRYTLNVGHHYGCTSLLKANTDFLAQYAIGGAYNAIRTVEVECVRYDALYHQGIVPPPDVIKVDVEGYEHQVLLGFGELLAGCIGIEAEAWLYPAFCGQKLLHDLVAYLDQFGLVLRRTDIVEGFEHDMVAVNALFTARKARVKQFDLRQRRKFNVLCDVWNLPAYF